MPMGTNISAAFQAAKYATKKSIYDKSKQFIIFYSDGDANYPGGMDLQTLFVTGAETPTTFSLYLTPGDTVPKNIVKMTANIKANGYSSSNQFTNLWSIKSNLDSLQALIKKNIFPVIFSTVRKQTPKEIAVNAIIKHWFFLSPVF
jgi:hypothetical protein